MLIKDESRDELNKINDLIESAQTHVQDEEDQKVVDQMKSFLDQVGSTDGNNMEDLLGLVKDFRVMEEEINDYFNIPTDPEKEFKNLQRVAIEKARRDSTEMKASGVSQNRCYKIISSQLVRAALTSREKLMSSNLSDQEIKLLERSGEDCLRQQKKIMKEIIEEVYGAPMRKKRRRK